MNIIMTLVANNLRVYTSLILCILFHLSVVNGFGQQINSFTSFKLPEDTEQVILITTDSWNTNTGTLQRYEKFNDQWIRIEKEIPVAVGKNGLAWGRGLHTNPATTEKKEGDGKAPAGVFKLGIMFGYGIKSPSMHNYPYKQSTERDYWVDDQKSNDYNTWQSIPQSASNDPKKHWASFERMKRSDHLYEYGIVIRHNDSSIEKGEGSAIFFHVWRTPGSPTLGCTSIAKENLIKIMSWLDPTKNPLVIQVPESEVFKL